MGKSTEQENRTMILLLIDQANKRITYAEERRTKFLTMSGGIMAAGFSVLVLLGGMRESEKFLLTQVALLLFAIACLGCGIWIYRLYSNQTNPKYSFINQSNTALWFYRDALPEIGKFENCKGSKTSEAFKKAYESDKKYFFAEIERNFEDQRFMETNKEQLLLLYANDLYKNRFLSQIKDHFKRCLIIVLVLLVAAIVAGVGEKYNYVHTGKAINSADVSDSNYSMHVSWKKTGSRRSSNRSVNDTQLLFNLSIKLNGKTPPSKENLVLIDNDNFVVPVNVEEFQIKSYDEKSGLAEIAFTVWMQDSFVDSIKEVQLK